MAHGRQLQSRNMFFSLRDQLKSHETRLKAIQVGINEIARNPQQDNYQSKLFTHYEALRCEVLKCIQDIEGLQKRKPCEERAKKLLDLGVYLREVEEQREIVKNMPRRPAPPAPA